MLHCDLIYTGNIRAKKILVLMLPVRNVTGTKGNTFLKERL
jgi:hypothetical protein